VFTAHESHQSFEHNGITAQKRIPLISGDSRGRDLGWDEMRPSMDLIIYVSKKEVDGKPMVTMRLKGTPVIDAADPTPDARLPAETVFAHKILKKLWDAKPQSKTKKPDTAVVEGEAKADTTDEGSDD
jgi:hypothetical protein